MPAGLAGSQDFPLIDWEEAMIGRVAAGQGIPTTMLWDDVTA
jgi:hypothetical protein